MTRFIYVQTICFVAVVSSISLAEPINRSKRSAAEHVEKPSDNARARLLLDAVGATGNIMKAAEGIANVGVDTVDVGQKTFDENTNEIVKNGQNAVDRNTLYMGNAAKSMLNTGGDLTKGAFQVILTVPRFFVDSFGTVVGADVQRN